MRTPLRRLRGVAATALLWAIVWGLAGAVVATAEMIANPGLRASAVAVTWVVDMIQAFGFVGAIGGSAFALGLAAVERHGAVDRIPMRRAAALGALGGLILPFLLLIAAVVNFGGIPGDGWGWRWLAVSSLTGGLGAACSTATLALARRPVTASGSR